MKRFIKNIVRNILHEDDKEKFWIYREKYISARSKTGKRYYYFLHTKIMNRNNAGIPLKAMIEDRPAFPHGLCGIFISQGARIGMNCTIFHQVTIGSNTLEDTKNAGAPVIGNGVYIGAGAKIIGGVKIGNNVRIGANCIVIEDIPDNCSVVMSKPRIIKHRQERCNAYKAYPGMNGPE